MRLGVAKNNLMFVAAFAAAFAAMAVNAPKAKSQSGFQQRMTVMHANPQLHFSILDTSKAPSSTSPVVGKFVGATSQSSQLIEGHPYPDHIDPSYLYGVAKDGTALRRVGQTGTPVDNTGLANQFSRITGAWLVQKNPFLNPQTLPGAEDLKEHFVISAEINQGNPSLIGNSTAIMLVNPATMAAYPIAGTSMFLGPSSAMVFEDVCFGVYPGADGDFTTLDDNEYRYFMAYSVPGTDSGGFYCLSLSKHETMNGVDPPNPFNPVPQERGPGYTNVFPRMDSNPKHMEIANNSEPLRGVVPNGQVHCRAYYLRPGIPNCAATPNRVYVIGGWVTEYPGAIINWAPRLSVFSLATNTPMLMGLNYQPPPPLGNAVGMPFSQPSALTDDLFQSMTIVGDYAFCTIGVGNGDGFGRRIGVVYLPEMIDGGADGDVGMRGLSTPNSGQQGTCGYMVDIAGKPVITYVGSGLGVSTLAATRTDMYQDYGVNPLDGAGFAMSSVDMHTDEEKLLGLNLRQAPQPFVGFFFSEDPANNFDGFRGGGGKGSHAGGCAGSAGGGTEASVSLFALVGLSFLMIQVLREARKA
jgi:hypothetical protein